MCDWLAYLGIAGGVVTVIALAVAFGFSLGRCERDYRKVSAEIDQRGRELRERNAAGCRSR